MNEEPPAPADPQVTEDPAAAERPPGWPPWFRKVVLPYIDESGLWVVLIVLLAHVVMVLAVVQLFTVRDRHFAAGVGLIALVAASVEICRAEYSWHHKLGVLTASVVSCWVAAAGVAWAAARYGIL